MKKLLLVLGVFVLILTVFSACGAGDPIEATGVQPGEVNHRTVNINGKLYYSEYTGDDITSIRKESEKLEKDSGLTCIGCTVRVDNNVYPSEHLTQTNFYRDVEVYQYNNGETYYYYDTGLTSYVPLIPAPNAWVPGEAPKN